MSLILILAAIIILVQCTCIIAKLSPRAWLGSRLKFLGLSAAYALMAGGAVGTAAGWHMGPALLLIGVAGTVIFDRRHWA